MSKIIAGKNIEKLSIVDDDKDVRDSIAHLVEDVEIQPIVEKGPCLEFNEFIYNTISKSNGVICDHHLKHGIYSTFDGAQAVADFYKRGFPAVLCTNRSNADTDAIRPFMKYIPSLIPTPDLDPDTLYKALRDCINELKSIYLPSRKAWRALVRVVRVDLENKMSSVVLPGWNSKEEIRLPLSIIPTKYHDKIIPGERFHASVNKGVENKDRLYFDDFEFE